MLKSRNVSRLSLQEAAHLNETIGNWVYDLAPWQVFATLTFEWASSQDSARRLYQKFMSHAEWDHVQYFYSIEVNPGRDGHHVHAVWYQKSPEIWRRGAWQDWFRHYGRARIVPVLSRNDVADYVAKYVTKKPCWWNLRVMTKEGRLVAP